jgi:hypothetical protein
LIEVPGASAEERHRLSLLGGLAAAVAGASSVGIVAVRGSAKWTPTQIEQALSEEALTAAIMPRYNLFQQVSRVLGTKLGSLKERPEVSIGKAAA